MIHAYDKNYLEKAQKNLACMLDFAVNNLNYDIDEFFDLFLTSEICNLFESGEPNILVGKSGIELAYLVLEQSGISYKTIKPFPRFDRTKEYWTGWALAYYQWETSIPFTEIIRCISIKDIRALYNPYHEMDICQFCDCINETIKATKPETNLKRLRKQLGFSQKELALKSGIPLRTIQQYEQRQKNINKAQIQYLIMLASALYCNPSDLIEHI